ncbi:DUF4870 domain-containing protein [Halomicroarcula sp. GCM10025324]|uniref:DUF4870 domain-containing protein n=1 Tax=Haloarcula TaxID=2237 RepID=UPI0023E855A9|nr:DUF4870 domain-containing protein [Halomicroarcula sp. ZS-22-S1]
MVSEDDDSDTAHSAAEEFDPAETASSEADAGSDTSEAAGDENSVTDDEQTWAVVLHASAFSGLVVPFGNIFGPLLVWLIKKDESEFIDESGKEALNFQLTWTMLLLGALLSLLVGIGFLLVPLLAVAWIVIVVLATVRASERVVYDYPLTVDLID